MREIKFRARPIDKDFFINGSLIKRHEQRGVTEFYDDIFFIYNLVDEYQVKPETIGQFTGLHDKNGKEIYEGDIVRAKYRGSFIGQVVYDRGSFKIQTEHRDIRNRPYISLETFCQENGLTIEVIGNIYENPEHLKEID